MRIFIPRSSGNSSGKGNFCNRLSDAMVRFNGVKMVENFNEPHDISLHIIRLKEANSRYKVLRLDGVYHNTAMNYNKSNKGIRNSLRKADAIIYQSNFSKMLCDKYLGVFNGKTSIINNGADPKFYDNIKPAKTIFKYNFLTASRWRPHKRLNDAIESFLLADISDSCLYIAGDIDKSCAISKKDMKKFQRMKNIIFLGRIDQKKLGSYLKITNAFIHLCWFDNCPNGVVEAICSRSLVITNNVGGTHEIVSLSGGDVLQLDKSYNLEPCDLYHPPSINRYLVADACINSLSKRDVNIDYVDINNVALRYFNFFKKVAKEC